MEKNKARSENSLKYEKLLWQKIDIISEEKKTIQAEMERIYNEIQDVKKKKPLSHKNRDLLEKETYYWDFDASLRSLKEEENQIQEILEKTESRQMSEEEIKTELLKLAQDNAPKKLSKKKQRMLEERGRLGSDPRNDYDITGDYFGTNPNRITSGKNRTSFKGNTHTDSLSAETEFFEATSGTHGGKVRRTVIHKKKDHSYSGKGGKRVRKH